MAEEEKNIEDIEAGGMDAETSDTKVSTEPVVKKAPAKKSKKRRKSSAKKKKTSAKTKHTQVSDDMKKDDNAVSLDLMLVVFLSLSLILNLYFFYQNGVLQGEIEELKTVNPGSGSNIRASTTLRTIAPSGGSEIATGKAKL